MSRADIVAEDGLGDARDFVQPSVLASWIKPHFHDDATNCREYRDDQEEDLFIQQCISSGGFEPLTPRRKD